MRKRSDNTTTTSNNLIGWLVAGSALAAIALLVSFVLPSGDDDTDSGGEDTSTVTTQLEGDTDPAQIDSTSDGEADPVPNAHSAETAAIEAAYDLIDDGTFSAEREERARWWAAPGAEDALVEHLAAGAQTTAEMSEAAGGAMRSDSAVLAVKVAHVDDNTAQVLFWSVAVISADAVAPPQAVWLTTQYDLVWIDDRWQLAGQETALGPAPGQQVEAETIFDATEFQELLEGFVPLHGQVGGPDGEAGE
ncbi:MAG: hypothetical protein GY925_00010 [Actinomycetia bacterium]|nr:hypothetical protein [Actinomycetes bacterium]